MTEHVRDKGPFKGKGALALDLNVFLQIDDWRQLVTAFHTHGDAIQRAGELDSFRDRLREWANDLIKQFKQAYPSARLQLVKSPDRSNTYIRWRLMSRDRTNPRVELNSDQAIEIIESLPANVCRDWMRFEEYRIQLNYYMALVVYEFHRTNDHIERLASLGKLRRQFCTKTTTK